MSTFVRPTAGIDRVGAAVHWGEHGAAAEKSSKQLGSKRGREKHEWLAKKGASAIEVRCRLIIEWKGRIGNAPKVLVNGTGGGGRKGFYKTLWRQPLIWGGR